MDPKTSTLQEILTVRPALTRRRIMIQLTESAALVFHQSEILEFQDLQIRLLMRSSDRSEVPKAKLGIGNVHSPVV